MPSEIAPLSAVTDPRTRLLEGMARAVSDKGYADTTIADIVREASVSRRTFYENFADKSECLVALYELASGKAIDAMRSAVDPQADWQRQIELSITAYINVLALHPVLLRTLFIDILGLGAIGLAARRRANQQLVNWVVEVVNNRPGPRVRKTPLPPVLAMAVVGGVNELVLNAIEQGQPEGLHALVEPATALLRAAVLVEY
jgi:AcrR family transcriptional regulator